MSPRTGETSTTCSARAASCSRRATSWPPRSRWSARAARARQELDPRGARPRVLPLGRFEQATEEFAAVVERYPVNDFAHFCLGRSLEKTGRREARRHPALAAYMRPDREDYQAFRERLRAA